jgi:hypothetical protein
LLNGLQYAALEALQKVSVVNTLVITSFNYSTPQKLDSLDD